MLHIEDFLEVYCLSNNKTPRGMAERESATFGRFSLGNASVSKFTTQIYPLFTHKWTAYTSWFSRLLTVFPQKCEPFPSCEGDGGFFLTVNIMIILIKYIYNHVYFLLYRGFYLEGIWLWRISGGMKEIICYFIH